MSLSLQPKSQQFAIRSEGVLIVPVGENLSSSVNRTINPYKGAVAYDRIDLSLWVGNDTTWTKLSVGTNIGDVVGPANSTDNAIVRYDGTTGKIIQNSTVIVSDAGAITGIQTLNGQPVATNTNTGDLTLAAFGSTPNANSASITNQVLTLQPASDSFPGGVSTIDQSYSGYKTFNTGIKLGNMGVDSLPYYNTPSYFEQRSSLEGDLPQLALSSGGGAVTLVHWHVQKCGRIIHVSIGNSGPVVVAVNGTNITAPSGSLPVNYRPLAVNRMAICFMTNNSTQIVGLASLRTDGAIFFYSAIGGVGFSNTGNAGTLDTTLVITN